MAMSRAISKEQAARWKRDPISFITEVLRDPETGRPFVLYRAEERFLREALTPLPDGSLPYGELLYGAPKKSGKSTMAALAMLYLIICLAGVYGEGIILANDQEQATDRIFQACVRIVRASPMLKYSAKITAARIEFVATGSTITAIASDAPVLRVVIQFRVRRRSLGLHFGAPAQALG